VLTPAQIIARKKMAATQKKRWAAVKAKKAAGTSPGPMIGPTATFKDPLLESREALKNVHAILSRLQGELEVTAKRHRELTAEITKWRSMLPAEQAEAPTRAMSAGS
jgi:hypothetical protein